VKLVGTLERRRLARGGHVFLQAAVYQRLIEAEEGRTLPWKILLLRLLDGLELAALASLGVGHPGWSVACGESTTGMKMVVFAAGTADLVPEREHLKKFHRPRGT